MMSDAIEKAPSPPRLRGILILSFLILGILGVFFFTFGVIIWPGTIGVRQITLGPGQGFSADGLSPGLHWNIPFYSRIHVVPQTVQFLHFDRDKKQYPDSVGVLNVQTSDGATVDADISILTRFYSAPGTEDGLAHGGPADLIKNIGISSESWTSNIKQLAQGELRRALGRLSSAQFYDPGKRQSSIDIAFKGMVGRLAPYGAKIDAVLLRRFTYRSDRIDNAIFQKNLQDQEERYNEGSSKLAEARAELEGVSAEWDAKIKTLRIEGENQAKVLYSEAELYEKKKIAEGDLLVAKARAEVDGLRAGVFAQALGSDVYVARELVPLASSLRGGVVADVDPYDLEMWLKRFGLSGVLPMAVSEKSAAVVDETKVILPKRRRTLPNAVIGQEPLPSTAPATQPDSGAP